MSKTFPCPRCGEPSTWAGNESRPFCSERCKLIDLGAWANGDYTLDLQKMHLKQRILKLSEKLQQTTLTLITYTLFLFRKF